MKLHGKVAVVTGGLRGIGHAIALAMAQEGADLLIAGLSMDRAAPTEQEIKALGRRCVVVQADVADEEAVKAMIARTVQHFGVIINITSASGHYGGASAGGSAYDASKGGLQQLTYALAAEFGPHHIRVNAIAPGVIVTERLGGQAFVEAESTVQEIARTPSRRLGLPADVGKAAVFLACDDSSYINGTTIVLDGGTMAVW